MKLIIAGSRSVLNIAILIAALNTIPFWNVKTVLCGTATGVDTLGKIWALRSRIPVEYYPADWDTYGKSAGYKRNVTMAENADALLAIWDGKSKGTKHMIDIANERGLSVYVYKLE